MNRSSSLLKLANDLDKKGDIKLADKLERLATIQPNQGYRFLGQDVNTGGNWWSDGQQNYYDDPTTGQTQTVALYAPEIQNRLMNPALPAQPQRTSLDKAMTYGVVPAGAGAGAVGVAKGMRALDVKRANQSWLRARRQLNTARRAVTTNPSVEANQALQTAEEVAKEAYQNYKGVRSSAFGGVTQRIKKVQQFGNRLRGVTPTPVEAPPPPGWTPGNAGTMTPATPTELLDAHVQSSRFMDLPVNRMNPEQYARYQAGNLERMKTVLPKALEPEAISLQEASIAAYRERAAVEQAAREAARAGGAAARAGSADAARIVSPGAAAGTAAETVGDVAGAARTTSNWKNVNTAVDEYLAGKAGQALNYAGQYVPQGVKNLATPVANAAKAFGETGVGQVAGKIGGVAGKGLGLAGRYAPQIAGAVELARRVPAQEMYQASQGRQQAEQQVANMTPQQKAWMQQHAPGVFQTPDYNEAFKDYNTYSKFYGGPNRNQNIADVFAAPMNVATLGGWELLGGKRALENRAKATDQANQYAQQTNPNYQKMVQQEMARRQQTTQPQAAQPQAPFQQAAQTLQYKQQIQQRIQRKQQEIAQLNQNPQLANQFIPAKARTKMQQTQAELQYLQQMA